MVIERTRSQRVERAREVRLGELFGVLPPAGCLDELTGTSDCPLVERSACEERAQLGRFETLACQRGADGQRLLPLGKVAANGLAGDLRIAPNTEQIVDCLERNSEMVTVTLERIDDLGVRAGKYRADRRCKVQQRAGFALH